MRNAKARPSRSAAAPALLIVSLLGLASVAAWLWLRPPAGGSSGQTADGAESTAEKAASQGQARARLVLVYTDGGGAGPAALTLRLSLLDSSGGGWLELPKGVWHRALFEVEPGTGRPGSGQPTDQPTVLDWRSARVEHFPTVRRLRPETTLEAIYRLDPSALPAPGSKITARLDLDGTALSSPAVSVGAAASDAVESRRRQARVALRLRAFESLLGHAEAMLETAAEHDSGPSSLASAYWYQGLALEGLDQPARALEAYRRCLERQPSLQRPRSAEPLPSGKELPIGLLQRIRRLESRLQAPEVPAS